MDKEIVEFEGKPIKCVYSKGYFKIYSLDVDRNKYPLIKNNSYGNVSILGELPDLAHDVPYKVIATEEKSKYGTSYRVSDIFRDIPMTPEDTITFLKETLTEKQADTLYSAYPDIIDKVKNNNTDDIDVSKLHGIGEEALNKILNKIKKTLYLSSFISMFGGALSISEIEKLYHACKTLDLLIDKLKKEPYTTLTKISGIGFKKADSIVLNIQENKIIDYGEDVRKSLDRCIACIVYLLKQNEKEGNTKMNLIDLRKQCFDLVPACANHFAEAIKSDSVYYNKENLEASLKSSHEMESYIAEKITKATKDSKNEWDFDVSKYKNVGEFDLSDEQLEVLNKLCKSTVTILNGSAGSGKSFSTKAVINMLDDNQKSYLLFAPTGKSAKVLADFTGKEASTIHRALARMERNDCDDDDNAIFISDVIIIDEFSMVDVWLFYRLLKKVDFNITKMLIIGDNAQLPSVGSGNLLHDFMESNTIPTVTLKRIFRYKDGGLMKAATDTRLGRIYLNGSMSNKTTTFGNDKDYVFIDSEKDSIVTKAILLYKKLMEKGCGVNDIQILCCKNVGDYGTIKINEYIQQIANPNYKKSEGVCVGSTTYYKGDLVMECENNYDAETLEEKDKIFIANGESGIIEDIQKNYVVINFDGVLVKYTNAMMKSLKLGYAITVHKSQGSSIENVIFITSKSDAFVLNSNLIYVGLTRTKKRCYHIGVLNTVNNAIKKKANLERNTFMKQLLLEFNSNDIDKDIQTC